MAFLVSLPIHPHRGGMLRSGPNRIGTVSCGGNVVHTPGWHGNIQGWPWLDPRRLSVAACAAVLRTSSRGTSSICCSDVGSRGAVQTREGQYYEIHMFQFAASSVLSVVTWLLLRTRHFTTWLILPVVICLPQRLSHACLSISFYMVKLRMAH